MPTATPEDPTPDNDGSRTRLDKEIEEILARSGAEELKEPRRPIKRPNLQSMPGGLARSKRPSVNRLSSGAAWMVGALLIAFLAVLVSDSSPLFARLLVFVAVGCFFAPILSRFRRPAAPLEQKMWRGQVMDVAPQRPSMVDQLRDWWQNRTRR